MSKQFTVVTALVTAVNCHFLALNLLILMTDVQ